MVKGLVKFQEYFADYPEHYVIIGGTACYWNLANDGLSFRATKDIDLLIVIEKYSLDFNKQLWKFFRSGGYKSLYSEPQDKRFYRFSDPVIEDFPKQVEILCRVPDSIQVPGEYKILPVNPEEYIYRLSAIVVDEEYYRMTVENSLFLDGIRVPSAEALICLKIFAYLNLRKQKEDGESIDAKSILKHMRDVFRLTLILKNDEIRIPDKIRNDVIKFLKYMKTEKPEVRSFLKEMGVSNITFEVLMHQLHTSFLIDEI